MASYKDRENHLHEIIYESLSVLTLIYPTSADFKDKFKPGMFKKNNQPGSQQVLYFLLSIIDQEQIHERITCWPTDVRQESKFRVEVMRFYAHLQEKYADFGLQTLLSSHLITPGGYKFAKFIQKLSDLAMYVHLTKGGKRREILFRAKPGKDAEMTSDMVNGLKVATKNIMVDVAKVYEEHESVNREYDSELETIEQKLLGVKIKIHELNKRDLSTVNTLEDEFQKSGAENYEDWLKSDIQTRLAKIAKTAGKFEECTKVTNYLISKDNTLIYNKANHISSDFLVNVVDSDDKFNLINFFETFSKYLQEKLNDINFLPANFIKLQTAVLEQINVEQEQIHNDIQTLLNNIAKSQNELLAYKEEAILSDM